MITPWLWILAVVVTGLRLLIPLKRPTLGSRLLPEGPGEVG
jgi:hypothetical protein